MDLPTSLAPQAQATEAGLRNLRSKLLDLTANNPLVSFKHRRSAGNRTFVRAVDRQMDKLFAHLQEAKPLPIRPLPPLPDRPADEDHSAFQTALERERLTDASYAAGLKKLDDEDAGAVAYASLERSLRDRVRAALSMEPWRGGATTPLPEHAAKHGIDPSFDLVLAATPRQPAQRGTVFQTLLLEDALQRQLSKIRDIARTVAEETGVSTLHLAFGFLEWFESDSSENAIASPLLLLRVDIERKVVRSRYQYEIAAVGDDAEANLTLSERLTRDFNLKLPPLAEDESPEQYLARIEAEVCEGRPRWAVRRWATLSHFPFARLAMYEDMDPDRWPNGLSSHPLVAGLLGGQDVREPSFSEELDVDDDVVANKVPLLVLDADASQHSAVYDVMCGRNLVIQGPPGTGKSQTITNTIAAALAAGRRVLFVADKQAALQVVKGRLDSVGLGDFCLELHSGKAKKKDVLESLMDRLQRRPSISRPDTLDRKVRELEETRTALTRYVRLLNSPFGKLNMTVHDVLWADRRKRDVEAASSVQLDDVELTSCTRLDESDIAQRRDALDRFEAAASEALSFFGKAELHPWWGVTSTAISAVNLARISREVTTVAEAFASAVSGILALADFDMGRDVPLSHLLRRVQAIGNLVIEPEVPPQPFSAMFDAQLRESSAAWRRSCKAYRAALRAQAELLALPDEVGPERARNQLLECRSRLQVGIPTGLPVGSLPSWIAELQVKIRQLERADSAASRLVGTFAVASVASLADLSLLVSAADLAAEAPLFLLENAAPGLLRPSSAAVVAEAAARMRSERASAAALGERFSIPPSTDPARLRAYAAALASSGLFGFLSPEVRAAKLCHAGMARTSGKTSLSVMAEDLRTMAEHLERQSVVDRDGTYLAAFGSMHRGLSTDIETAEAVAAWGATVRLALAGSTEVSVTALSRLFAGPQQIQAAKSFAIGDDQHLLRAYLQQFPAAVRSFADLAGRLSTQAAAIEQLNTVCLELGIPAAFDASRLGDIEAALTATAVAHQAAQVPGALTLLLGLDCPKPLGDHDSLERAERAAYAASRLNLPPADEAKIRWLGPDALRERIVPAARQIAESLEAALRMWVSLKAQLGLNETLMFGDLMERLEPGVVADRLRVAVAHADELGRWVAYLRAKESAEALDLRDILSLAASESMRMPLRQAFDRVLYHSLARAAFAKHPELDRFSGLEQETARARYAELDRETMALRRTALAEQLSRHAVPSGVVVGRPSAFTDEALIRHEHGKRTRHIPIRRLFDRAGAAVQALKPCMMMSPLSVAQYLKPGGLAFDLLVIDEASQMRPEDAIGCVARCDQIVIVGDPKQLPPTAFFARADSTDDDDHEDAEVDAESILDMAQTRFHPVRRLRWHYRSRHGSLVAFSNREFYDDDLIVFPSPSEAAGSEQGVQYVKVDGIYQARSNDAEIQAVCEAAVEHMRVRPDRSLGIATMNQVQRELIQMRMDQLAAALPEVQAYLERWGEKLERFFVKNLENVQGDERDSIYVSTVFGPSHEGGKVKQTFGPINGASGHRRLNVLFTRAKHHLKLFTSMEPDDILAGPQSPRGAHVLKAFLVYAQTARLDAGEVSGREPDSDFEIFVQDRLKAAGFDSVPQVGVAGYFIDLGVRNPTSPATFLAGIECDGAAYHSSKSARDRDILRQRVLEGLGWRIYGIWSTDWFRDPDGETRKLVEFLKRTRNYVSLGLAPAS